MSEQISIDGLTKEQWSEIRSLAVQIYKSKQHGKDELKCAVHAFLLWVIHNDFDLLAGEVPADDEIH